MSYFDTLAASWATAQSSNRKLLIISTALISGTDEINTFINEHREGWLGDAGKFARVLAKIMEIAV